jgi:hypothetical protein
MGCQRRSSDLRREGVRTGRITVKVTALHHDNPESKQPDIRGTASICLSSLRASRGGVTMDFVTDLLESTASAYTSILVVVDRLTKMTIYLP